MEAFEPHLNTNNKFRDTSPRDQHCCMPQADLVLMSALVSARWPQMAITNLSKDLLVILMPAFCKYGCGVCAYLLTETTKRAIGQAVDTMIDSKRSYIVMSEEAMGYPAVPGMFVNFQAVGEGCMSSL